MSLETRQGVTIDIVVSKYTEDISWLQGLRKDALIRHVIYDKSDDPNKDHIPLVNVGREAETLLTYILSNYECLPDYTIFLQGDPGGTPPMYTNEQIVPEIEKVISRIQHNLVSTHEPVLTFRNFAQMGNVWARKAPTLYNALFKESNEIFWFAGGAQYVLPKQSIICRPKKLYKRLRNGLLKFGHQHFDSGDPSMDKGLDAWTMEVMWGPLFDPGVILREDYAKRLNAF